MASKLPLLLLLIAVTCRSQFYRVSNSVIAPALVRDLHLSASLMLGPIAYLLSRDNTSV